MAFLRCRQCHTYKVDAVLNEMDGLDHSGRTRVGVPALFGMNFQSVSTAQKLPASDGLAGGYLGSDPGPLLQTAQTGSTAPLVAPATDDDVLQWWLSNRSPAAYALVRRVVNGYTGLGNNAVGAPVPWCTVG